MLRLTPGAPWPLLLAAVRDEFVDRTWDPPAAHWPSRGRLVGGRDRVAGGTWLVVRPDRPALAAVLNGVPVPPPAGAVRPSRGGLPLGVLSNPTDLPADLDVAALRDYDGFHLLHATPDRVTVWSWDGANVTRQQLAPGDHIIVNDGVDAMGDPLVPHFAPLLGSTPSPALVDSVDSADSAAAWGGWVDLLRGDSLVGDDPRALIVRREHDGRAYGSTSASLVALRPDRARFDFTATPANPTWVEVPTS
jgi:hypothetical protein